MSANEAVQLRTLGSYFAYPLLILSHNIYYANYGICDYGDGDRAVHGSPVHGGLSFFRLP